MNKSTLGQVACIFGTQWGDEGKGKVVDILAAEYDMIARFSGGEQDLANLCLRIAISQVVAERSGGTQVNFIVLDEIFGSQDEERKELIMNTLQHLSSQFRQIFVITHVEEIKDVLPVVVSVTEKDIVESIATLL